LKNNGEVDVDDESLKEIESARARMAKLVPWADGTTICAIQDSGLLYQVIDRLMLKPVYCCDGVDSNGEVQCRTCHGAGVKLISTRLPFASL